MRIGGALDEALSGRVYETIVRLPLKIGDRTDGMQPLRDLDSVRSFLSGLGPIALFDLPWLPVYLAICFAFHPLIGIAALVGAIILGRAHVHDRSHDPRTDPGGDTPCDGAQRPRRDQPPQRRGDHGHGHDRPHRGALGRCQSRNI